MLALFKRKGPGVQDFPGFGGFSFLFYLYLYAPIVVLVVFSFNANQSATVWTGFSLDWYRAAFANQALRQAAGNSLLIAVCASMIATVIATLAALGTSRGAKFKGLHLSMGAIMLPLVLPEIVVGVATLALFSTIGLSLGYGNLIIAHTVFCIPFAYLPIRARLNDMDLSLEQASADLYAGPWRTFRKVTLPLLMPGIFSGLMLAFIVSLDNFVISMMVSQAGTTTLPIFIFGLLRMGVTPDVNAVSTLILGVSVLFVSLSYLLGKKNA
ncbi:ABC transporter permease [Pseudomonas sp. ok266]|uniref:ABC transporter permease n=1 Tax=Pseudomonas sp. ok266 TaxID=1761896 RepID=UPI0008AFA99F|nr:ABC transporter permease [Pseudomonas sp. ok266]SEP29010.1 spermidine/putrescine transport system permease protein [Pseudomonas sp. ok266]